MTDMATGRASRLRAWLTTHHFAQVALLVHPLIVVRTGGEYLRLKMAQAPDLPALVAYKLVATTSLV